MMIDKQLLFSDAQVLSASGNSTNYLERPAPTNLGGQEGLFPFLLVHTKSGTTPTLRATLVGADDAAFTANKVTLEDTGTVSDPPLGFIRLAIPTHSPKKYFRVEYVLGGGTPGFTVSCGFATGEQTSGV